LGERKERRKRTGGLFACIHTVMFFPPTSPCPEDTKDEGGKGKKGWGRRKKKGCCGLLLILSHGLLIWFLFSFFTLYLNHQWEKGGKKKKPSGKKKEGRREGRGMVGTLSLISYALPHLFQVGKGETGEKEEVRV